MTLICRTLCCSRTVRWRTGKTNQATTVPFAPQKSVPCTDNPRGRKARAKRVVAGFVFSRQQTLSLKKNLRMCNCGTERSQQAKRRTREAHLGILRRASDNRCDYDVECASEQSEAKRAVCCSWCDYDVECASEQSEAKRAVCCSWCDYDVECASEQSEAKRAVCCSCGIIACDGYRISYSNHVGFTSNRCVC